MLQRKYLLGSTIIAGFAAALIAVPGAAFAQTAKPDEKPVQTAPTTKSAESDEGDVSALVVTGSRIKRSEFTSSAPIQVITSEQSSLEGLVDTGEILQQSSVAAGSFQVNSQLTGFVVDGAGPGVSQISLRGLGANRTLVLLNGRRVGPAGVRGQVGPADLNVIPQSVVDRFEILKDGASSIYGSDAVAGVVNIITKNNYDGGELRIYGNQPFESGGESVLISGSWGKTFDRGYVTVSGSYQEQFALRRGDRDDTSCASDYLFDRSTGLPIDYKNPDGGTKCYNILNNVFTVARANGSSSYGGVFQYAVPGMTYPTPAQGNTTPFSSIGNFVRGARATFPATYPYANYDSPYWNNGTVISPTRKYTLYATGGFDLTSTTQVYGEFLFNRRESSQDQAQQFFPTISATNANNPFAVVAGDAVCTAGNPCTAQPIIAIPNTATQDVNYYRGVVGIRGDLPNQWNWDIYAAFTRSDGKYSSDIIYNDRVNAVTGSGTCNQSAITISGGQCSTIPGGIPWFSQRVLAGQFNDAERAFLFANDKGSTTYDTQLVEATLSGDLFKLPAGPVGAAVGFSVRHESIDDQPGANTAAYNLWGQTSAGRTKGDDTVKEVFGELEVPLLKGIPAIESLDLSVSGRYTDYDVAGANSTYKVGLNWQITPAWRVRATKGTSFRGPALYELYLANQTGFLGQTSIDPCIRYDTTIDDPTVVANCIAATGGVPGTYLGGSNGSALITSGGGTNLKAETSDAITLGVVWTPGFIDLQVAVDYTEIEVDDEVSKLGAYNIIYKCLQTASPVGNPYCSLFTRGDATDNYGIRTVTDSYLNIAKQTYRGIDLTMQYRHEFDFGRLTVDGQVTWSLENKQQLFSDSGVDDYNGTTFNYGGPDVVGNLNFRFDRGDWTVYWGIDMYGKGSDVEYRVSQGANGDGGTSTKYPGIPLYYKRYTEFTSYHDISVRKKMDDWTFQIGVQNLFDERPPAQSTTQFRLGTAALNGYDVLGRRAFVSVSKKW